MLYCYTRARSSGFSTQDAQSSGLSVTIINSANILAIIIIIDVIVISAIIPVDIVRCIIIIISIIDVDIVSMETDGRRQSGWQDIEHLTLCLPWGKLGG